jgi:hypothetical protein
MFIDLSSIGKLLLLSAIIIGILGLLLMAMGNIPFLGRLPGDLVIRRSWGTFAFPIMTSIVLSVLLTILLNLIFWLFRH